MNTRTVTWKLRNRSLDLGTRTLVMGVVNITPDSFSDGGTYYNTQAAIDRVFEMVEQGADIVDIGAESTRPGAARVGARTELDRLLPVLNAIAGRIAIPVSVDTYKAEVAREVLARGAEIVNDISGLTFDPPLAAVIAEHRAGLVLMHTRGRPEVMQELPPVPDVWLELLTSLGQSVDCALGAGVARDQLVVDPGIGFGKTVHQNLEIIQELGRLGALRLPILIGTSRKSFLGRLLDKPAQGRIFGTAASVALSIARGAHIVRVHDVAEMGDVCRVTDAIIRTRTSGAAGRAADS